VGRIPISATTIDLHHPLTVTPQSRRRIRRHTTRGEICVQIGRLDDGQLGQLGIDGAFHDDGRFHPLAPDILPQYSDSGDVSCNLAAPIRIGLWSAGDRSAAPSPERTSFKPTAADLRSISWGCWDHTP
jgi:hypothetical protein